MNWFYLSYWRYLFSKPYGSKLTLRIVFCRIKGHPHGTVWFNPGGLGPDMRCRDCGEDLG